MMTFLDIVFVPGDLWAGVTKSTFIITRCLKACMKILRQPGMCSARLHDHLATTSAGIVSSRHMQGISL